MWGLVPVCRAFAEALMTEPAPVRMGHGELGQPAPALARFAQNKLAFPKDDRTESEDHRWRHHQLNGLPMKVPISHDSKYTDCTIGFTTSSELSQVGHFVCQHSLHQSNIQHWPQPRTGTQARAEMPETGENSQYNNGPFKASSSFVLSCLDM